MGPKLDKISIRGFKSIERLDGLELGGLNVLIGANGSGKSNFVEFFRMMRAMMERGLQAFMMRNGPSDGFFYNGVSHTKRIEAELDFGGTRYAFYLLPTSDGKVVIEREERGAPGSAHMDVIASGSFESGLLELGILKRDDPGLMKTLAPGYWNPEAISTWQTYHFHDTSATAGMRRDSGVEQTHRLAPGGENLAAFLLGLSRHEPRTYTAIRSMVRRIAPFFDDFDLKIRPANKEDQVRLTWRRKGTDYLFSPGHLSDGTLRFIAMTTALLQPTPPSTIVIDEPELGLHPEAIMILAGLLRSASARMQIIVATQSPTLLGEFAPEDVITVDQVDGASRFTRLDKKALKKWLADFTLGELWIKGNIRGGVNHA